ncbi:hypothetical protein AVEN_179653-1 [Araneus ventricosus]|uniref:Uncharacterized protein n=1 Tax=Araneus ventricosus TaxID=182803 RepID=A0A4Y2W5N7_ARAVE|nr:hypothetical protein AVEN_179653-1 [Araneus ventricosus]
MSLGSKCSRRTSDRAEHIGNLGPFQASWFRTARPVSVVGDSCIKRKPTHLPKTGNFRDVRKKSYRQFKPMEICIAEWQLEFQRTQIQHFMRRFQFGPRCEVAAR